ncbi:hypothetical protein ACHAXM_003276 [Skeletonema potamos]
MIGLSTAERNTFRLLPIRTLFTMMKLGRRHLNEKEKPENGNDDDQNGDIDSVEDIIGSDCLSENDSSESESESDDDEETGYDQN